MTILDANRPVAIFSFDRAGSFVAAVFASITGYTDAYKTRKALSKLTTRELEDIGLTYADLDTIGSITR